MGVAGLIISAFFFIIWILTVNRMRQSAKGNETEKLNAPRMWVQSY